MVSVKAGPVSPAWQRRTAAAWRGRWARSCAAELGLDLARRARARPGRELEVELAARVGGDRLAHLARQLAEVLVGEAEREPVAARLGEHLVQRRGQAEVVVHLVDVEGAVGPPASGRPARASAACQTRATTKEPSSRLVSSPSVPFGDAHEQQPALVEAAGDVDRRALLADDRAHRAAKQEGAQLVQHRPGRLRPGRLAELVVPLPEGLEPDRVPRARAAAARASARR